MLRLPTQTFLPKTEIRPPKKELQISAKSAIKQQGNQNWRHITSFLGWLRGAQNMQGRNNQSLITKPTQMHNGQEKKGGTKSLSTIQTDQY